MCLPTGQSKPLVWTAPKTWGLTTLAVAALAAGVFAVCMVSCSMGLDSTCSMLASVKALGTTWHIVIIASGCVVGGCGVAAIIWIHKPTTQPHFNDLNGDLAGSIPTDIPDADSHIQAIKHRFNETQNKSNLHLLYYHIACVTEKVYQTEHQAKWEDFLKSLHDRELKTIVQFKKITMINNVTTTTNESVVVSHKIDCNVELQKLEGKKPALKVEELKWDALAEADKIQIRQILGDAFYNTSIDHVIPTLEDLKWRMFKENRLSFAVKDVSNSKILAVLVIDINQKKEALFHNLARTPSATKLGMTDLLKQELKEILKNQGFTRVWCEVDKWNESAKRIYEKLGFKETKSDRNRYTMDYPLND